MRKHSSEQATWGSGVARWVSLGGSSDESYRRPKGRKWVLGRVKDKHLLLSVFDSSCVQLFHRHSRSQSSLRDLVKMRIWFISRSYAGYSYWFSKSKDHVLKHKALFPQASRWIPVPHLCASRQDQSSLFDPFTKSIFFKALILQNDFLDMKKKHTWRKITG